MDEVKLMEHLAVKSNLSLIEFCEKFISILGLPKMKFDAENETEWASVEVEGIEYNVSRPYEKGTLQQWDDSVPSDCNFGISLIFKSKETKQIESNRFAKQVSKLLAEGMKTDIYFHRTWLGPGKNEVRNIKNGEPIEKPMKLNFKKRLKKLYRSSMFITLFATTLGVLLAFYLNNLNARAKIEDRKQISIQNLRKELANNKAELLDSKENDRLIDFLRKVRSIDSKIPNELTTSVHSINSLRKHYSDFLIIKDSTVIDENLFEYNIQYKFELSLIELQKIAWETSKMSNITSEFDYDCLQSLVKVYSLHDIYSQEQQKILNHFVTAEHNNLLSAMLIVQQLQSQLLEVIIEGEKEIENCG